MLTGEEFSSLKKALHIRSTFTLVLLLVVLVPLGLAFFLLFVLPIGLIGDFCSWIGRQIGRLRGVGKRIDDPVFGPITYQGATTWSAERNVEALGGLCGVDVWAPRDTGPGPAQHDLWRAFVERQHDIRKQAEESIYREYQKYSPQWRKDWEGWPEILKGMPILKESAEIWKLLSDCSIALEDQPGCFWISWNPSWSADEGVSRTFADWELQEEEDA
jgi:hypothetical protein